MRVHEATALQRVLDLYDRVDVLAGKQRLPARLEAAEEVRGGRDMSAEETDDDGGVDQDDGVDDEDVGWCGGLCEEPFVALVVVVGQAVADLDEEAADCGESGCEAAEGRSDGEGEVVGA